MDRRVPLRAPRRHPRGEARPSALPARGHAFAPSPLAEELLLLVLAFTILAALLLWAKGGAPF